MRANKIIIIALLALEAALALPGASATLSPQESVNLYTGDNLTIKSDAPAIQKVVVRGNLTAASISNVSYPARSFTIASNATESYSLNILLSYQAAYTTNLIANDPNGNSVGQLPSYYVSSGDLNLTIIATFQAAPGQMGPIGIASLYEWMAQFGAAFPPWIKVLYLVLGLQFAFVGYRWVRFEDERRRLEGHLPPLDRGNRIYLWTDVAFKALIAGFGVSLAIMVGEVLVVAIAQYLFLINLTLVSLVDLFSLFFVAVLGTIVYLAREGMDRFLDLKPMMED